MLSALVDRLTYRSHVLDMNGSSYRLKSAQASAGNGNAKSDGEVTKDE